MKDIIAHVSTWEREALTHLPHIVVGGRAPRYSVTYGGIDAFNAVKTEEQRQLPVADILRQRDETHERLVHFVEGLAEEHFSTDTRCMRRIRLDTYGHYRKHAGAIRAWRERCGG